MDVKIKTLALFVGAMLSTGAMASSQQSALEQRLNQL